MTSQSIAEPAPRPAEPRIPREVWILALAALLMGISAQIAHTTLAPNAALLARSTGVLVQIEAVALSAAVVVPLIVGWLSDRFVGRKSMLLVVYGASALAMLGRPFLTMVELAVGARIVDRLGPGAVRPPRDALIADATPAEVRGSAFGLVRASETLGTALGFGAGFGVAYFLNKLSGPVQLWTAVVPAFLALAVLAFGLGRRVDIAEPAPQPRLADMRRFDRHYWSVVAVGVLFTVAGMSATLMAIRAGSVGLAWMWIPVAIVVKTAIQGLTAFPVGLLQDRVGARPLLVAGFLAMVGANLALGLAAGSVAIFVGFALWGLAAGLSDGVLAALVATAAPAARRGTAFGLYDLVIGVVAFPATVIAGRLMTTAGMGSPFFAGAAVSTLCLIVFLIISRKRNAQPLG